MSNHSRSRACGGDGGRHGQVGFGWISLDSALLTQARPHFPPPAPRSPRAHVSREEVGFGRTCLIRPPSLEPARTSRHPCFPSPNEPTFHKNRSDLVGFAWIRLSPSTPVRISRQPCPLRHEPTSRENRLDLAGFTRIRPSPPQARSRFPPAAPLRQEPTLHEKRLDLIGFSWIRPFPPSVPLHGLSNPQSAIRNPNPAARAPFPMSPRPEIIRSPASSAVQPCVRLVTAGHREDIFDRCNILLPACD